MKRRASSPSGFPAAVVTALLAALGAASGCGDNLPARPDANRDAPADAATDPPPPALGPMVDRVGRPLIARLLVGTALPSAERRAKQRDYQESTPLAGFRFEAEIAANLALYDGADSAAQPGDECRPVTFYPTLARVLANDRLFVDTTKAGCDRFFSVERDFLTSPNDDVPTSCGGFAPSQDAVDDLYSVLIRALGSTNLPGPPVPDGVGPHADTLGNDSFPFLGREHL